MRRGGRAPLRDGGTSVSPAFTVCCAAQGSGVSGPRRVLLQRLYVHLRGGRLSSRPTPEETGPQRGEAAYPRDPGREWQGGTSTCSERRINNNHILMVTRASGFGASGAWEASEAYCFFNTWRTLSFNKFPTSGGPFSFSGRGLGISWLAIAGRRTQVVRDLLRFEVRCFPHGLSCKS